MLSEKGLGEVHKVGDHLVVAVCPIGGKLKAVAGLFAALAPAFAVFLDMAVAGGIGIVFGVRTVGDDKNLHILIQPGSRPEAVPLIAFDLIERFPDRHTPPLELHMDKGKTVDKDGHIITGVVCARVFLVLVDHLQAVVVDRFMFHFSPLEKRAHFTL